MEFRDLKKQYQELKPQIDAAMKRVCQTADFISGTEVKELEYMLAEYTGVKHCITCANGTDALTLALMAWNIGRGDAVFVPDFTFFASGETVAYEGAVPVFVDVEEDTFNMSPDSLKKAVRKVKEEGKLVPRAILAVDLFGQPADYSQLRSIAKEYELLILEDGAQGFGGQIGKKKACSFGDISTTSFFPAKQLGCYGDGGAVFTDNDEWAALMRSYRIHGKGEDKYDNVCIGVNSRLDELQAALLQVKLKYLDEWNEERRGIAARCLTELHNPKFQLPVVKYGTPVWHLFVLRCEERDRLQAYLEEHGIGTNIHYPIHMHEQKAFAQYDLPHGSFPVAEQLASTVLSIPMFNGMTQEEVTKAIEVLNRF